MANDILKIDRITVEDLEQYTVLRLLHKLIGTTNELVDSSNDIYEKLDYLLKDGLSEEVAETLTQWLNDGTLSDIITEDVLAEMLTSNQICIITNELSITQINELLADNYGTYIFKAGEYNVTSSEGIIIKSNSHVIFEPGAVIKQTTLDATHYNMILIDNIENVVIDNPYIQGERSLHTGTDGEWGHGITIYGSKNIIINNPIIHKTWGDGIYIGLEYYKEHRFENEQIKIVSPFIKNCSRNGISVCSSKDIEISNPTIIGINRTAPAAGIDIEPEFNSIEGVFLGKVKLSGICRFESCGYGLVMHLVNLPSSNIEIDIQDIVISDAFSGVHINSWNELNKGVINIDSIDAHECQYSALYIHNKGLNLPVNIHNFIARERKNVTGGEDGEYGSCIWFKCDDSITYEVGNVYINSVSIPCSKKYGRPIIFEGKAFTNIKIDTLDVPPFNSYHNPVTLGNTKDIKIGCMLEPREIVYGTPNELYTNTYCQHLFYSDTLVMDQQYYFTIKNSLPDGVYTITNGADTRGTYGIEISTDSNLTPVGFSSILIHKQGGYVEFRKKGNKLYLQASYGVVVNE